MKGLFFWQRLLLAAIVIVVSSCLLTYAAMIHSSFIWGWLAPVPLLLFVYYGRFAEGFLVSVVTLALSSIGFVADFYTLNHASLLFTVISGILMFSLMIALCGVVVRRVARWWVVFLLPAVWVALEYFQWQFGAMGSLGDYAYTQVGFLPLIQIASLTGIWGVTFMVLLGANALTLAIYFRHRPRHHFLCWVVPFMLIVAVLAYGLTRISEPQLQTEARVALISLPPTPKANSAEATIAVYRAIILPLTQRYPIDVVALPERTIQVNDSYWLDSLKGFANIAKAANVTLIVGVDEQYRTGRQNAAWVFSPAGKLDGAYVKHNFLPGQREDFVTGHDLLTLSRAGATWGVVLCTDIDFESFARRYARQGTGLLFVLDRGQRDVAAYIQADSAVFRAVENDYAVALVSMHGYSVIVDARGRLLDLAKSTDRGATILRGTIRLGDGNSVYVIAGNWFPWVCLLILVLIFLRAFLPELFFIRGRT